MRGFLYILQSQLKGRYYIGSTNDLSRRLAEHNRAKVKYTRLTKPWSLVYSRQYSTLTESRKAEYKLKRQKSRKVIEKLIMGA